MFCIAVTALLLSCAGICIAQGFTVSVNSSDALTTAIWDPTVSVITVERDLKLFDVLKQRWSKLSDDYLLTRNLTITGPINSLPALDINYWRFDSAVGWKPKDNYTAKGIRLGPGVTLKFQRLIIKKSSLFIPEPINGGTPTSMAIVEDCIFYRYMCYGSADYTMKLFINTPRPTWALSTGDVNTGSVLPAGYCRSNPYPPLCWPNGDFITWDWASDWTQLAAIPLNESVQSSVLNTVLVCEDVSSMDCYNEYFSTGNRTCIVEGATMLQKKEAGLGVFWLGKPASQQQIDAAAAGYVLVQAAHAMMLQQKGKSSNHTHARKVAVGVTVGSVVAVLAILAITLRKWKQNKTVSRLTEAELPLKHDHNQGVVVHPEAPHTTPTAGAAATHQQTPYVTAVQSTTPYQATQEQEFVCCEATFCTNNESLQLMMPPTTLSTTDASSMVRDPYLVAVMNTNKGLFDEGRCVSEVAMGSTTEYPNFMQTTSTLAPATSLPVVVDSSRSQAASAVYSSKFSSGLMEMFPGMVSTEDAHLLVRLGDVVTPDTMMPTTLVTDIQLGTDVILGRKIGSGGMGTVYEATFRGDPVAVKLLSPGADLKSFEHELGILGRTHHPNVIRLLAANLTSSSQPLLVEELAHGSLEELMYNRHVAVLNEGDIGASKDADEGMLPVSPELLPLSLVLSLALDIASGLAYLHPTILHRDLKPANVLLTYTTSQHTNHSATPITQASSIQHIPVHEESDVQGDIDKDKLHDEQPVSAPRHECASLQAKISDFGLSRMHDAMTIVTQKPHCGTLPYMAPECFARKKGPVGLTHKCDIYSFGVLLWEMIHNTRPWKECTPVQVVYEVVVRNARPPIKADEARCPRQLRKLIARCWDADPYRRPPALEVARELALIQRQLHVSHGQ